MTNDHFYRYVDYVDYKGDVQIECNRYKVIKYTPKGAWLSLDGYSTTAHRKYVRTDARRSFAYSSKVVALHSYEKRKQSQISILARQLKNALTALQGIPTVLNQLATNTEDLMKYELEQKEEALTNILIGNV